MAVTACSDRDTLLYRIEVFERSSYMLTIKVSPNRFLWMRNSKIIVEKEGELIFYDFFDHQGTGAASQGTPKTTKFHWPRKYNSWC